MKNEELKKLRDEYLKIIDDCKILTVELSDDQMNWHPEPGKWSIAECIQHITVTNTKYYKKAVPVVEKALNSGKFGSDHIKLGMIGKMFMGFEPPPKRKFKNPGAFSPKSSIQHQIFEKETVVKDFIDSKMEMIKLMEKADGLNLNKIKLKSPVSSLISVRLGVYFKTMAPHDRRHLWQASRIKDSTDFPG